MAMPPPLAEAVARSVVVQRGESQNPNRARSA
jgi:hypothetical protein